MSLIKIPIISGCNYLSALNNADINKGGHIIYGIKIRAGAINASTTDTEYLPPGIFRNYPKKKKKYSVYTQENTDIKITVMDIDEYGGLDRLKRHCATKHKNHSFYIVKLYTRPIINGALGPICVWKKQAPKVDNKAADPVLQLVKIGERNLDKLSQDELFAASLNLHTEVCVMEEYTIRGFRSSCEGKSFVDVERLPQALAA